MRIQLRDEYLIAKVEQEQRDNSNNSNSNSNNKNTVICTRGLESRMTLESLRKQSHRLMCLEEVLIEQEKQWDNDDFELYDFQSVAAVYNKISKECRIKAEQMALKDRQEVVELVAHSIRI